MCFRVPHLCSKIPKINNWSMDSGVLTVCALSKRPHSETAPDNSPQSIGELCNGHVANLQELYYTRLVRKMAWYKILIQVLIVFLRITMCVPYCWCTKHAQLIMGTWPIYKKHFLQLILTKKSFHLIKCLLGTFIFFLSFQSVLGSLWNDWTPPSNFRIAHATNYSIWLCHVTIIYLSVTE